MMFTVADTPSTSKSYTISCTEQALGKGYCEGEDCGHRTLSCLLFVQVRCSAAWIQHHLGLLLLTPNLDFRICRID